MPPKKILIAEDDELNADLLHKILSTAGYYVVMTNDGKDAVAAIEKEHFDALITDWMMPRMDGIELIRQVRASINPAPLMMVVTALVSEEARDHALNSGADDFLTKPFKPQEILSRLDNLFSRGDQPLPLPTIFSISPAASSAPFTGVFIAASTGGPPALKGLIESMPATDKAVFFIVQHSPAWALEDLTRQLQKYTSMKVSFAESGMKASSGRIYIAPDDRHLAIEPGLLEIRLLDDPPENFVRPSADLLFRSGARCFGRRSIAVVLTGMGRDGTLGASHVSTAGGVVIVQDPLTAIVQTMPRTVLETNDSAIVVPLADLPRTIASHIELLSQD